MSNLRRFMEIRLRYGRFDEPLDNVYVIDLNDKIIIHCVDGTKIIGKYQGHNSSYLLFETREGNPVNEWGEPDDSDGMLYWEQVDNIIKFGGDKFEDDIPF